MYTRWPRLSLTLHVLAHHGNHEVEKTDGLDEGETQNGVREELTTHAWVAGNTLEESGEDETDTDTLDKGVRNKFVLWA